MSKIGEYLTGTKDMSESHMDAEIKRTIGIGRREQFRITLGSMQLDKIDLLNPKHASRL